MSVSQVEPLAVSVLGFCRKCKNSSPWSLHTHILYHFLYQSGIGEIIFRAPGGILTGNMAPKDTAQKLWCKLRGINWVCYTLVLQKRQVLWAECHLVIVKKQYMAYSQSKSVINSI